MKRKLITLLVAVLLMTSFLYSQTGKWEKTKKENTIEAYELFLKKHQKSIYNDEIQYCLDSLNWVNAIKLNNLREYSNYLTNFPNGQYKNIANIRVDSLTWRNSFLQNTVEDYSYYVTNFPNGHYIDDANTRLEEIYWKSALNLNSIAGFNIYITEHPNSKYIIQARQNLKILLEKSVVSDDEMKSIINKLIAPFTLKLLYEKCLYTRIKEMPEGKFSFNFEGKTGNCIQGKEVVLIMSDSLTINNNDYTSFACFFPKDRVDIRHLKGELKTDYIINDYRMFSDLIKYLNERPGKTITLSNPIIYSSDYKFFQNITIFNSNGGVSAKYVLIENNYYRTD
jgi:hypothetical protein